MRLMLITNGLGYGGAERVVEALAEDLLARGHQVMVVATTRGGPIAESLAKKLPVELLEIRSALDLRAPRRLSALIERFEPQLIHSHLAVADLVSLAAGHPRVPRFCTAHNPGVELGWAKKRAWSLALPRFERVFAVSQAVASWLPVASQVVHPSLVSLEPQPFSKAEARQRLGVSGPLPLVLGVGRLAPIKGWDVLAAALRKMKQPAQVVVAGDGPQRQHLAQLGLSLLGPVANIAQLMVAADLVVVPSRSEGFPQVPLEAFAAGVPVVATAVGGTPELVQPGVNGWLVPPNDPQFLARSLDHALRFSNRAERGAAGRRQILQRGLTRQAMVDRYEKFYLAQISA